MAQNNLELTRTLDDSWNAQDWETFEKRHSRNTAVFWPAQAEPTRGRNDHKAESIELFKTFPDNHLINHPYKVEIAQGEWTCTVPKAQVRVEGCADASALRGVLECLLR